VFFPFNVTQFNTVGFRNTWSFYTSKSLSCSLVGILLFMGFGSVTAEIDSVADGDMPIRFAWYKKGNINMLNC